MLTFNHGSVILDSVASSYDGRRDIILYIYVVSHIAIVIAIFRLLIITACIRYIAAVMLENSMFIYFYFLEVKIWCYHKPGKFYCQKIFGADCINEN